MKARMAGLASFVLLVAVFAAPAAAGVDIQFGADVVVDDRADLYISISAHYFDHEPRDVRRMAARYSDPDDLAVALFIMRHSGRDAETVWNLRRRGRTWWEIGLKLGVPVDLWFVEIRHDPGPPYGKAYGHWKNHRRDDRYYMVLDDDDIRNLVAVRLVHEYYGLPVQTAMQLRAGGDNLRWIVSEEYGRRHGPGRRSARQTPSNADTDHGRHPGRGRGHGKGHKSR